jgi:hypothetical protein
MCLSQLKKLKSQQSKEVDPPKVPILFWTISLMQFLFSLFLHYMQANLQILNRAVQDELSRDCRGTTTNLNSKFVWIPQ